MDAITYIETNPKDGLKKRPILTLKYAKHLFKHSKIAKIVLAGDVLNPVPCKTLIAHFERVTPDDEIQRKFERFHLQHPEVYEVLARTARGGKRLGLSEWGIGAVYEVARWQHAVNTKGAEHLKISNDFRSRYARLLMEQEGDLKGFFRTRELRTINQ